MQCSECACHSETAPGWVATLVTDPDDADPTTTVVMFCPPCAAREYAYEATVAYT